MPVGLGETTEPWTTFATWTYEAATDGSETKPETGKTAFTSHNLVLESSCDRCHHADNPWGLSDEVSEP
jgi:hypothetical protein